MNSMDKIYAYYLKIKKVCKEHDLQSFESFYLTMSHPGQEVIFLDYGILRVNHIIPGHMGEMHAFVFSKEAYRNLKSIRLLIHQLMITDQLRRLECTVDAESKGQRRMLEMLGFELEGIVRMGVRINGRCKDGARYVIIKEEVEYNGNL